ncbi:unnamed protein product, partial [marine sediment metagenome]
PIKASFATELNLTLLAGDADDRYYVVPGRKLKDRKPASIGEEPDVSSLQMVDEWANIKITVQSAEPCCMWRYPVETVSQ